MSLEPDRVEVAKTLIENIARREYGADWHSAIVEINIGKMHVINVVAKVAQYNDLELLAEQASSGFGFIPSCSRMYTDAVLMGQPHHNWSVTRNWWFTIDTSSEERPDSLPISFVYSETRRALVG